MGKNFLDSVILRVDFLSPIDVYEKLDSEVAKEITKYYKKAQPKTQRKSVFVLSAVPFEEIKQQPQLQNDEVQWVFNSQNSEQFTIASNSIVLTTSQYVDFEKSIKDRFSKILKIVFDKYSPQLRRIGLRYINKIPTEKDDFLDDKLFSYNELYVGYEINNSISTIELNKAVGDIDVNLRIQQGKLKTNEIVPSNNFILDFDGFTVDTIYDYKETMEYLDLIHGQIKNIFSSSITGKFKEHLK